MKFENTEVWGFKHAIRGCRNPLESWSKSDSCEDENGNYVVGNNDMNLMQRLIKASMKEGNSHSKFLRQVMVSVDITAPLYWWKEFDTYKVGTVANSTSQMHKLATTPIALECFEMDDCAALNENGLFSLPLNENGEKFEYYLNNYISFLEELRKIYLGTKDKTYWKELVRWLPQSWLQTRTVTMNYQNLRQMYFDRRYHKLNEWSGRDKEVDKYFIKWVESLPYAKELICYEEK